MTKTIVIILSIILILTLGIFEQIYIDRTFDELIDNITVLSYYIETENINTIKQVENIRVWWYKKRDFLELICPNTDIKDIAKEIGELEGAIISNADEDPLIRCFVITEMAKNSKNLLAFKCKNIF